MNKVALLVVYNHRFDKNISRINDLYKKSFRHVFHLMPFYDGNEPNVIPVYNNSYYFQSFISQAYNLLKDQGFTHYFIISDDLILNPIINEENLWEITGLPVDYCMLPYLVEIQNCRIKQWPRIKDALNFQIKQPGLEIASILPSRQEAIETFNFHGISTAPIEKDTYAHLYPIKKIKRFALLRRIAPTIYKNIAPPSINLDYPLVGGYSDILMVTADCMQRFCTYSGAFAAGLLFVEVALPTAMLLASRKIAYIKNLKLKNGDMWTPKAKSFLEKYDNSLNNLISDFPKDKLFLHPIKLSQFK